MGIYIYTLRAARVTVTLPDWRVVEAGVARFYTKPFWDAWYAALNGTIKWLCDGEKKTAKEYAMMLGRLKNIKAAEYVVIEHDGTVDGSIIYENTSPDQKLWYDDDFAGLRPIGRVIKQGRGYIVEEVAKV